MKLVVSAAKIAADRVSVDVHNTGHHIVSDDASTSTTVSFTNDIPSKTVGPKPRSQSTLAGSPFHIVRVEYLC